MKIHRLNGRYILQPNVNVKDGEEFYNKNKEIIENAISFADDKKFYVEFGTTTNDNYVCNYLIEGATKAYIKGIAAELKSLLKQVFKTMKLSYEIFSEKKI